MVEAESDVDRRVRTDEKGEGGATLEKEVRIAVSGARANATPDQARAPLEVRAYRAIPDEEPAPRRATP